MSFEHVPNGVAAITLVAGLGPTSLPSPSVREASVTRELKAKAEEKEVVVRQIILNIERALKNNREKDRQFLQKVVDPSDQCFCTLVQLAVGSKYEVFVRLRCVTLRAMQMMLRVAVTMVQEGGGVRGDLVDNPNVGMLCFKELATQALAREAFPTILSTAKTHEEPLLACDSLIVLAELGPEALSDPELLLRMLDLFCTCAARADELVEVALRIHAYGGQLRARLLQAALEHPGGKLLCEVLLQLVNRGDESRRIRAVKLLTGCLAKPSGKGFLYTNDARVLVEILLRDLPNSACDSGSFVCYAECLKALAASCEAAHAHRREEMIQVLEDLRDDDRNSEVVRLACSDALAVVLTAPAALPVGC
eukprot:TRINITY_DN38335_c0_g1_i1.p1 TRINITY_DN38335_c0_g1~~TRINITY_DN38335_c0_g1_i1.p1  ORF type:complete len:365 (-),score=64.33 TRINITY_DN38335_c0_g1_i1:160-1254(-)